MDTEAVAKKLGDSIGSLAMHWMAEGSTFEQGEEAGMPRGLAQYAAGRWGVLGDCPLDNGVGAAFFWNPATVR